MVHRGDAAFVVLALRFTACLWFPGQAVSGAMTAREVMEEVQRRSFAKTFRYEGRVTVQKANGEKEDKSWRYERLGPPGNSKVMLRFISPPEIRGVALLIWNHTGKAADIWLYTPAIARHRRIAQQDRSAKFAGTDLSFEDLEEDDISQWDYSELRDDVESGEACWRLTAHRKTVRRSQYDKNWIWISKEKWTPLRMDKWRNEKVVRRLLMGSLERRQSIWTPMNVQVSDMVENSFTTLQLFDARYDSRLADSSFTLEAMRSAW